MHIKTGYALLDIVVTILLLIANWSMVHIDEPLKWALSAVIIGIFGMVLLIIVDVEEAPK